MLKLENINLALEETKVIRNISFDVKEGELLCLLGPSGCGKTTTLRLIAGLETPDSGTVSINGANVSTNSFVLPPYKRDIGFLFQDFALFPHLTVKNNIAYGLKHLSKAEVQIRTTDILGQIRLEDHSDKYPHMLSGGEQQRVALARALAPEPSLLLMDEPFSGLDTSLREKIREETLQILKERGVTTVLVTHDPEEAMLIADQIVLMNEGNIVQCGIPSDIYHQPTNIFSAEFFGNINKVDGEVEGSKISTDIGTFSNKNFPSGSKVDVLIRQDGIRISPDIESSSFNGNLRVCDVRYSGNSSLVSIGIGNWPEPHTHIVARELGRISLEKGKPINLEIDHNRAFIFKK
jgi:iron(III) transport system ATP-binding protein